MTVEAIEHTLANPEWSPETRKSARSVAVVFFGWTFRQGITRDVAGHLDTVRVPQGVPRPAPDNITERALNRAPLRTRQMILLARYGGLRCCEIAVVHGDDWDGQMLLVHGKGGKRRLVPILDERLTTTLDLLEEFLFPGKIDGHLSADRVNRIISNALPGKWTAHTLRHRYATAAYAGTRDLLAVGKLLGHSRPETTQRYVLEPQDALLNAARAARAASA
ncbi:hypothetical protein BM477_04715 [Boudabousia marimammalium]|uniref:Tyr recombinase domain-containing protein n=2 Tax=Boudabousia marimammalium TaxID=156892 RepID=A0A1Q5PNX3_9ACTO|nr:hypothetical protein BM477_04715 [Boudabousia marimammalium]